MRRGELEYTALHNAMATTDPSCRGDARFIADELDAADEADMRRICRECPLASLCAAYAVAAKPTGGWWAGRRHEPRQRTTR